jgi:YD repeat-containing protein
MSDPAGTTTYSYDRLGMLRLEKREVTGVATPYETRYRHDADGNRSAIIYPSGQTITFGYDAFGRPVTAATASASLVTNASYAPFGPLESLVLGNGTTQTMPHDARYRVTQNKLTSTAGTSHSTTTPMTPSAPGWSRRTRPPGQYERYSFYSPELQLLAETDATLAPSMAYEYVWFAGRPLAQLDIATSTVHWTFADHLGTPLLQTDASATIDWRAEHEPYGRVHTFRARATRHQPLRFPGQEYDDAVSDREYNVFR